jgi:hypothetical protein
MHADGGGLYLQVTKTAASGAKNDRVERRKVMAFAQAREIDAILARNERDLSSDPSLTYVSVASRALRG